MEIFVLARFCVYGYCHWKKRDREVAFRGKIIFRIILFLYPMLLLTYLIVLQLPASEI